MADDRPDPERIATPQEFGRELTLLRHRAELTVRQVAKAAGLPASTAGDYFSGRHLPAPGQGRGQVAAQDPGSLRGDRSRPAGPVDGGAAAGPGARPASGPGKHMASGDAPYRGLASFGPQDAPWFFGREDVTQRLVELAPAGAWRGRRAAADRGGAVGVRQVVAAAAGLMPRLTGPVTLFVPTATPRRARDTQRATDGRSRYVIVDQFEAVFTRCQDEDQRREFITAVCELAMKATVILALRADFYDQALRYPGWPPRCSPGRSCSGR